MALFCYKNDNMPTVKDFYKIIIKNDNLINDIENLSGKDRSTINDEVLYKSILFVILLENYLYDSTNNEVVFLGNQNEQTLFGLKCCITPFSLISELYNDFLNQEVYSVEPKDGNQFILCGMNSRQLFIDCFFSISCCFVNIELCKNKIILQIVYDINLLYEDEVKCYFDRLKYLLSYIFKNRNMKVEDISLEKDILSYYHYKHVAKCRGNNIIGEFKKIVTRFPAKNAVSNYYRTITYSELDSLSDRAAIYLLEFINRDKARVAIFSERSVEYIVLILAILKLGYLFIPIDKKLPEERINMLIKKSNADVVVTTINTRINFCVKNFTFCLGDLKNVNEKRINDSIDVEVEDAYILFTSGTTGEPKGVLIPHFSVVNMKHHFQEDFSICSNDIIGQFASISFDASISEIFMALFSGACLYIYSDEEVSNINLFLERSNKFQVTVITLPPLYSKMIDFKRFTSLRLLITAGSVCSIEQYKNISQHVDIVNAYGPTECTVCATIWHEKDGNFFYNGLPIGKAVSGARVYVLDQNKKLLPPYVVGEIYISGYCVGKGYIDNEDENNRKFLNDIFFSEQKMYKTGDYGRILPDGNFEFWGRIDDQVKYNGIRIELAEINKVAERMPGIKSVYAKLSQDPMDRLCLYYTTERDIPQYEIRKYLEQRLPAYAVPNYIVKVDNFVLNNSGKIDGSALLDPDTIYLNMPREKMAFEYIFERNLNLIDINLTDNFFALGGSSLVCIKIISEIHEAFGVSITVDSFINSTCFEELFLQIQKKIEEGRLRNVRSACYE